MKIHKFDKLQCIKCDEQFQIKVELEEHLKTHFLEKLFNCMNCDTIFKSKDELREHMTNHTQVNQEKEEKCKDKNLTVNALKALTNVVEVLVEICLI